MSISTKKGDKGYTSLRGGERVWKDDPRVEAYGTIDELDSRLGEAKHFITLKKFKHIIEGIQENLYRIAGQLASKDKVYDYPLCDKDVEQLDVYVSYFEKEFQFKGFIIPGSTIASAKLDICRTVARRAERRVVSLSKKEKVLPEILQYINRLSDLLFLMARLEEKKKRKIKYKRRDRS